MGHPCTVYPSRVALGKGRRMKVFMGKTKHRHPSATKKSRHSQRCGSGLCCNSCRLSVSSSSSSEGVNTSDDSEQLRSLSNLAHGMVQARLQQMINQWEPPPRRRRHMVGERSSGGCVVLIAMDKRSYDPKGDFKMSIQDVITSKRMEEPRELRSLLNCYMSVNSPEHRQVILEAFHEVCCTLFHCSREC
ncbi:hypothetical protein B296_00003191 [Ensete ventricosum]|uniref:Transcription repressor n=1 Tax=Ensete ventricosum TaxID=4639 RepID=A0A427BBG3_ENSVE|nr:hypothetical protein B296_00003191 [Ensete ventricosum]